MDSELRTKTPVVRPSMDANERRKRFKTIFKQIRKIAAKHQSKPMQLPQLMHDVEPIKLALRVVFRGQGQLPAERLVGLHRLIKTDSSLASEALNVFIDGLKKKPHKVDLHCAIRHMFEE